MLFCAGVGGAMLLLQHLLAWAVELPCFSSCIFRFRLGFRVAVLLLVCLLLALRREEIKASAWNKHRLNHLTGIVVLMFIPRANQTNRSNLRIRGFVHDRDWAAVKQRTA
eukprot:1148011-Rhodomonas_salina.1